MCTTFVAVFSNANVESRHVQDLGESYDIDEIEAKIWNSSHMAGLTSLAAVLNVMRRVFNESGRDDTKHIVIFVSDAVPNVDYNDTIPEANAAKAEGAIIFFIGMCRTLHDFKTKLFTRCIQKHGTLIVENTFVSLTGNQSTAL